MSKRHGHHKGNGGKVIHSKVLQDMFWEKEMNRRRLIAGAAATGGALSMGGLTGCPAPTADDDDDDDSTPEVTNYLVGMGAGDSHAAAIEAALEETIGRDGLSFVNSGDVVYLKVNTNSGDFYPYSTNPDLVRMVGQWVLDRGATPIIGDRSFWGDPRTMINFQNNGIYDAAQDLGADLYVFDPGSVEWVAIEQSDAPDWNGGFQFPRPVVEADHIINLPCLKTHFISTFTMGMKNIIGLVNPADRQRTGNLDVHVTSGNKLYRQIAQLNEHITPSLTLLDCWKAIIRGGPTPGSASSAGGGLPSEDGNPGLAVASTDRIAADVTGLAILKTVAVAGERVHSYGVWDNPQIAEAVASGVGITGPDQYEVSGPTVPNLQDYLDMITG